MAEAAAAGDASTLDSSGSSRSSTGGRRGPRAAGEELIHEGWCVKESGTKFCGRYQWQKRWFRLVTDTQGQSRLSYYKACTADSTQMAGSVTLDPSYCTRPVEKQHGKVQPFCFAIGPLVEDGLKRTYYVSCASEQIRQEWMEVLDAVIEGVPEDAQRRRATVSHRMATGNVDIGDEPGQGDQKVNRLYAEPKARLQEWVELHRIAADQSIWKKSDMKSGIRVSRAQFADRSSCDQIKIEGVVNASVELLYTFLKQASQPGGKLDYPFRQEEVLEELEDEPEGHVFYNQYNVPWPRISQREICCTCAWVPEHISPPEVGPSCGEHRLVITLLFPLLCRPAISLPSSYE
eukprot:scpid75740/ scgid0481/ 